ncbi:MAG TPA: hypothetical protein VGC36_00055 [Rhizomicrobium sp.]
MVSDGIGPLEREQVTEGEQRLRWTAPSLRRLTASDAELLDGIDQDADFALS